MRAPAVLIVLLVGLLVVVRVADDGGSTSGPAASTAGPEARPGDRAVYRRIETSRDCAGLQETFDRAAANNDRYRPGSPLWEVTLEYMAAADARMRSVGCYG